MGRHLVIKKKSFLRTSSHDLTKLLRNLRKEEDGAVKVLAELLESKDEKIRMQAAQTLIKFEQEITEQIDRDSMQRMIAEIKFKPNGDGDLVEEEDDSPQIDFETVQEIG